MASKKDDNSVESVIAGINKDYGAGSVIRMGDDESVGEVEHIPTGIYDFDNRVTSGGIPKSRFTEIYGAEASGKTTFTLTCIAQAQKQGDLAAFVDAEHAFSPDWARTIGVDVDNLYISQPESAEQGLDIALRLVETNRFGIVVVDSVAALVPSAELEGDMGDAHMGLHARLMSQALRKLVGPVSKSNTAFVFVNQMRATMGGGGYGPTSTTTGGKSLRYYASLRLEVARIQTLKKNEIPYGNLVKITAKKYKCGRPYLDTEVKLKFDRGFDLIGSVLDVAVISGVVHKAGSWLSYCDMKWQGEENAIEYLRENPDTFNQLLTQLKGQKAEIS